MKNIYKDIVNTIKNYAIGQEALGFLLDATKEAKQDGLACLANCEKVLKEEGRDIENNAEHKTYLKWLKEYDDTINALEAIL